MKSMSVLGIDPSLTNWGYAYADVDIETLEISNVTLDLCRPVVDKNKQLRTNTKDEQRAYALAFHALGACQGQHMIFIETPVGSQSSRAQTSYGITLGIMGSLRASGFALTPVTARAVKLARTNLVGATKHQMIASAMNDYPDANWPMQLVKGQNLPVTGKAEHMADAIGCIESGLLTTQFSEIRQLFRTINSKEQP